MKSDKCMLYTKRWEALKWAFLLVAWMMISDVEGRDPKTLKIPVLSLFSMSHSSSVPRIIHQSWKEASVPKKYEAWQKSWKDLHPHWQYHLWTDEMNRRLVEDHYRWFLPIYDSFPLEIFRADAVRYMYMHKFGGVYADLDFRALKPMDELLAGPEPKALLGRLSDDFKWEQNIPNAWLASSPEHPFWMFCLAEIAKASAKVKCQGKACTKNFIVEGTTGPQMLWRSVMNYSQFTDKRHPRLNVLEPMKIYPLNWRPFHFDKRCVDVKDEKDCYSLFPQSYAVTYWSHGWGL